MTIDGAWTIEFRTPGGVRHATLHFVTDGPTLTGSFDDAPLTDGRVDGAAVSFAACLTTPFKVKIKATATIDGDAIRGQAKAAIMTIPFTGSRTGER